MCGIIYLAYLLCKMQFRKKSIKNYFIAFYGNANESYLEL